MSLLNSLSDFFMFDFLQLALGGTLLLSLLCGLLSPFIIAKKYAFMGEGVSHSTLVGLTISIGLLNLQHPLAIFLATLSITLILVSFLARSTLKQGLPSDSLIGIFLTTSLGLGVLINSLFNKNKGDLLSFLFGNILMLETWDLYLLIGLIFIIFPLIMIPYKKWIYLIYDEEGAKISGINTNQFHYLFFFLLTILIVCAVKIAGTILINTLMLIPGALAFRVARSMKQIFIVSLTFSLTTSLLGLILSNWKGLAPGATLALTQFTFFSLIVFIYNRIQKRKTYV